MINSVGPSFTGRTPIKTSKTAGKVVRKVFEQGEKSAEIKPKESLAKRILDDIRYGLETFAETFQIKL